MFSLWLIFLYFFFSLTSFFRKLNQGSTTCRPWGIYNWASKHTCAHAHPHLHKQRESTYACASFAWQGGRCLHHLCKWICACMPLPVACVNHPLPLPPIRKARNQWFFFKKNCRRRLIQFKNTNEQNLLCTRNIVPSGERILSSFCP